MFRRKPTLPDHNEPLPVDVLCAVTGIEREARVFGVQHTSLVEHSPAAFACVETARSRIGARQEDLAEDLHAILSLAGEQSRQGSGRTPEQLRLAVDGRILATFQSSAGVIRQTIAGRRQAQAELNAFRQKHGLEERSASYPLSKVNHFALVILLWVIESGANSAMYLGGGGGWLGAITTALAVAGVNVALAVCLGIALRFLIASFEMERA